MVDEPRWVPVETAIALNRDEVAKIGEPHEVRDRAALETAIKRPWNVWAYFMDRDFATLATSLLVALAGAKAFVAANERTAYRAAVALLETNGVALDFGGSRAHAEARLFAYFHGRLSQAAVADWFRSWMSAPADQEKASGRGHGDLQRR